MLNKTFSAITAILVIGVSGLQAGVTQKSVDISIEQDSNKSVIVTPANSQTSVTVNGELCKPTQQQIIQPAPSSAGYEDTIVYAGAVKKSYKVGEPIKIKLKLKRRAYIYFWTISSSGKGYLILPNNLESYNYYRANIDYVVPERSANYDFVSDRAGVEQVYVLATNKKISAKKIKSIFKNREATNKDIKQFITKDIKVIARDKKLKYDIASFQVQVHSKNSVKPAQTNVNIIINR